MEDNQFTHNFIAVNQHLSMTETGHLHFEQGRGVVKIEEADCPICEAWGLNDGRWHEVPSDGN